MRPRVTIGAEGYQRHFDAEIDSVGNADLRVRGALRDRSFALEYTWIVRTPDYEIVEAQGRALSECPRLDPRLLERCPSIAGVRIGRGFTRGVAAALGDFEGVGDHVSLAIEMARVGQQVYRFPPGFTERFTTAAGLNEPSASARLSWEQDRAYVPGLANSCYTYRDESVRLFAEREVRCTFGGTVTCPATDQKRVFWREKRLELALAGSGFLCRNRMQDTIHDIEVELVLAADGTIRSSASRGLRLPYTGICEAPQLRTSGLTGRRADAEFVRLLADTVGGASGCTHLFDLSVDCLRLFEFPIH
jgi:hypothetical protein